MAQHNAPQKLTDLLIAKNYDVKSLDSAGQPATDPAQAKVFNFNWVAESGKDYGTVVATIGENNDLTVYTGDNVGKSMEGDDKNEWFKFLEQLRMFAKKNLMTFSAQNLNKLKYSQQGQAAMKEGLRESWSGRRDRSWNGAPTEARLMIKHKRAIGEGEARFRYIDSLFIETVDGERFKLPFTKLSAGKAMLEHVRQGGRPYDPRGNHIATIVSEMNLLSRFRRANIGKIFEGQAAALVEQADHHYATLQHTIKSLGTRGGYTKYFEAWDPTALTDEDVIIEDLRCMFVEQNIDSRIEQALPLLAKLQKQEDAMKEIGIFEGWINCLSEGTWALPDTPEKQQKLIALLADELPVGPDATNATEQLYDLIGNDDLFDQLGDLARDDANADARTIVINFLERMSSDPSVAQVIGKLKIEKAAPPAEAPPAEPVAEAVLCETCNEAVCECGQYESVEDQIQSLAELSGTGMKRVFHNGQWVDPKTLKKPVSELSSDTLKSYIKKASSSGHPQSAPNLASKAAFQLGSGDEDDGEAEDRKAYRRSKGIGRAVDRLEEISDKTVQNYKDKAWDEFARGNDRRGAGIGRALDKQRGAFGHVKTTGQDKQLDENDVAQRVDKLNFDMLDLLDRAKTASPEEKAELKQQFQAAKKERNELLGGTLADSPKGKLDELGSGTLGSYVKKASSDRAMRNFDQGVDAGQSFQDREPKFDAGNARKDDQRRRGIHKAVDRLTREGEERKFDDKDQAVKDSGWKKSQNKDPRGTVTHLSDVARRAAEKNKDTVKESGMGEVDLLLQDIARGNVDIYDVYLKPKTRVEQYVKDQILEKIDEITGERGLHADDDIDKILDIIQADIARDYGVDESSGGGNFLESSGDRTALTGQYGHSGRMTAVEGHDADMMARIKFLAGVTR